MAAVDRGPGVGVAGCGRRDIVRLCACSVIFSTMLFEMSSTAVSRAWRSSVLPEI